MANMQKFLVTVVDTEDDSEHQIEVDFERPAGATMIDAAIDIAIDAKKQFAASLVDYDSFGSDSAYLDRLDKIADDRLAISSLAKAGEMTPFLVDGIYSDDQSWSERIDAVDAEDAAFSARWIMAANEGARPGKDFTAFVDAMYDEKIYSCRPDPVSFDELVELVRASVETPATRGDAESRKALVEALGKIDAA